MAKRRRTLLAKTKRTTERPQQRVAGPSPSLPPEPLEPMAPAPSHPAQDPPNPTLTPPDATQDPEPFAQDVAPPAPSLAAEQPVDAPEHARDMAQAAKQDHDDDFSEAFSKDVSTSNPAPERSEGAEAGARESVFPKDFEDGDDWFLRTGQPAPERAVAQPPVDAPIVTTPPNPWPLILAGLAVVGLIGIGMVLVLAFS